MHYNFLFNGCSWTYGSELEGLNKDKEHQRTHRFSHLVAEHLEKTYVNISNPAVSNDWIVEKTIEWFEKGNTCDVAVIQFTILSRTIWYDETNKSYRITPIFTINGKNLYDNHDVSLKARLYYKNFYSNILGHENYYKNVFMLEKYFELKNIKYIFICLANKDYQKAKSNWNTYCKNKKIKNIKELLGMVSNGKKDEKKDEIINDNYCLDLKDKKYPFLSGAHPSAKGHQRIADYIIREINNAL